MRRLARVGRSRRRSETTSKHRLATVPSNVPLKLTSAPADFLLVVDGQLVAPGDSVGVRQSLAGVVPPAIDQMEVMKPDAAQARFGALGRHGAVLIIMKRQGSE